MGRHREPGDLLGTMARCLAGLTEQAQCAGITLALAVPINPALLRRDTTALERLAVALLTYALQRGGRGRHLAVALDVGPGKTMTLAIDEQGPRAVMLGGKEHPGARRERAPACALVVAGSAAVLISTTPDGWLQLRAKLPHGARRRARQPHRNDSG